MPQTPLRAADIQNPSLSPNTPPIQIAPGGVHTRIHASLCTQCPHNKAGCCAAPPALAWADIGRIAHLGGADFLRNEMEQGRLSPSPLGLAIQRQPASEVLGVLFPPRCVYLGPRGCTLDEKHRSATCSFYVCEEALAVEGDRQRADKARDICEILTERFGAWDTELAREIAMQFPEGPPWTGVFFSWLQKRFEALLRRDQRKLRRLLPA